MPSSGGCRVDAVLKTIGDRWSLGILHALSAGPCRTLELHRTFKGLSTKTLASRLKKLQRDGIINRVSYRESPPRVEYSLTEKGTELLPVIAAVAAASRVLGFAESGPLSCAACSNPMRVAAGGSKEPADTVTEPAREGQLPGASSRKKTDVTLL